MWFPLVKVIENIAKYNLKHKVSMEVCGNGLRIEPSMTHHSMKLSLRLVGPNTDIMLICTVCFVCSYGKSKIAIEAAETS